MKNLLSQLREFSKRASYNRTLAVLTLLVVVAAIPLTVYVSQQRQEIRQHASGLCDQCNSDNITCLNGANYQRQQIKNAADAQYQICTQDESAAQSRCDSDKAAEYARAESEYTVHTAECQSDFDTCQQTNNCNGGGGGNIDNFNCNGIQPVAGINTEYQCQTVGNDTCVGGWTVSGAHPHPTSCGSGSTCCYRDLGPVDGGGGENPTPTPDNGGGGGGGGQQPTPTTPAGCPAMTCSYSQVNSSGQTQCFTGTGAVGFNQPGCTYVANCSGTTTCPVATVTPPGGGGGSGGNPTPTTGGPRLPQPTPTPVVSPAVSITCNTGITAATNPTSIAQGGQFTIAIGGGDASTYVGDDYGGGASCTGSWNNKSCTAGNPGTYTYTHYWQHCVGDFNHCSNRCSVATQYTVTSSGGGNPTATPTSGASGGTPTPIAATPTPPATGVALAFTLNLPHLTSNTPRTTDKNIKVDLINTAGTLVASANVPGVLHFNGVKYAGTISLNSFATTIAAGNYTVKVQTDKYLKKLIPGFISIPTSGSTLQTVSIPEATLLIGDINGDNTIDILDYNTLRNCFGKGASSSTQCSNSDLNDDGTVDEIDYNGFIRALAVQQGD